MSVHL